MAPRFLLNGPGRSSLNLELGGELLGQRPQESPEGNRSLAHTTEELSLYQ